ncbi:MAG: Nramp family divalent metal transporter [Planctomycetota bacterium]|nr:Nramp family divalent metal transporter [Planctomycetota bacterium]
MNDFKQADLPERSLGFWKMAGPGAILVGLSIGAGEIIIWPRSVAEHGAGMIWAAVLGVFLQLWINFEVGRWTVATGETVFTGFARVWRGFAPVFILLTILGWIAPGWARASGNALKALIFSPEFAKDSFWGSDTCWTALTFGAVALLLFGPKVVYKSVEISIEVMVAIVTLGLIAVAVVVGTSSVWKELGAGLVNIPNVPEGVATKDFFILLVFAGAGGTANLFYTFYLRDKNIGMGAHIPAMPNLLRGRHETIPSTGFRYQDNAENGARFKSWFKYIVQDQLLFFWFLNSLTIMLFIFGSLAVLHPKGIVPGAGSLIWDEAQVLGEVWGAPGRVIFLMVGVATLFSTQLALVDGVARSIADIVYTNFAGAQKRELSWWYAVIAGAWIVAGVGITFVMEHWKGTSGLAFLTNAAFMGGIAMAVYVPLMLYMNLRYLPKSARPGPFCIVMMLVATCVYTGFAVYTIYGLCTAGA